MNKYLIAMFFVGFAAKAFAQMQEPSSLLDQKGSPLYAGHYIAIEGSPYLFDEYIVGKAITDKGKIYDDLKLRYNELDNMLSFIYKNSDEPLKFEEPIRQFTLFTDPTMTFKSGYPKIDRQNEDTFYQVINYGKVTLLKFYRKDVHDSRNLAVAGVKGAYENFVAFYTFSNNQMHRVKPNKEGLLKALGDKVPQVSAYIDDKKPNLKDDNGLRQVFTYYNSL